MVVAQDDYTHVVGPEHNFNESMYFEFHDPATGLGGFLRLANRPNEGIGGAHGLPLPSGWGRSVSDSIARP